MPNLDILGKKVLLIEGASGAWAHFGSKQLKLNKTAVSMLKLIANGSDERSVAQRISVQYSVPYQVAKKDVKEFFRLITLLASRESVAQTAKSEENQFDMMIIGAGPAGLSAAITAKHGGHFFPENRFSVAVVDKNIGGLCKAQGQGFCLGFLPSLGQETDGFLSRLTYEAERSGVTFIDSYVELVVRTNDVFEVKTFDRKYTTKALVLAVGTVNDLIFKMLNYENVYDIWNLLGINQVRNLFSKKRLLIIGESGKIVHVARTIKGITNSEINLICSKAVDGEFESLIGTPISFKNRNGKINGVIMNDANQTVVKGFDSIILDTSCFYPRLLPFRALGLDVTEGFIQTSIWQETSVEGVFACGDCTVGAMGVANGLVGGQKAGYSAVKYACKKSGVAFFPNYIVTPLDHPFYYEEYFQYISKTFQLLANVDLRY